MDTHARTHARTKRRLRETTPLCTRICPYPFFEVAEPPGDPRLKPGPVFVASGGVNNGNHNDHWPSSRAAAVARKGAKSPRAQAAGAALRTE